MRDIPLNPRDPRLHAFLTVPRTLEEDPTYRRLRDRIERARAAHMPTRALCDALTEYVHGLLRAKA